MASVRVYRRDVIRGDRRPAAMLAGRRVGAVLRHGKQLAILGEHGSAVCVHLGMSGSLRLAPGRTDRDPHTHVEWVLNNGSALRFRDPRRFGGVWTFPDEQALRAGRWDRLGPDALSITPRMLLEALAHTKRGIKAALLDQEVLAGLGNIYVDELLHRARLHPMTRADALPAEQVRAMVRRMRSLLRQAIASGGTTLRDYVNGTGDPGGFQARHRVYGRSGQPCKACGRLLTSALIGQRNTTWCPSCQRPGLPLAKLAVFL